MTGTFLNVATVLIGGLLGLLFGARIPERLKQTVVAGLGLFTAAMGLQMFLQTGNPLIVLGSMLIGGLLGEWWKIEDGLQNLGRVIEQRFAPSVDVALGPSTRKPSTGGSRFVRGFLTASLLFCVGPMTILGSINDGLRGDYNLLAVKSVLDGFAAMAFASTLGVGVLFSALTVLIFQGGISLLAAQLGQFLLAPGGAQIAASDPRILEMTAAGGVILFGLALSSLLEIKPIRIGNFLPALAIAPLIVWVLSLFQ
ncbi:MAG TPA: DUF554 domain-containing protein [Anaerolineales bacterium]|jgi:hypothetical protein